MSTSDYKDFICEYPFAGSHWGFTISARSHEEAEERLRALCWAKVNGELMMKIPAGPGVGIGVRLMCWARNVFARGAA